MAQLRNAAHSRRQREVEILCRMDAACSSEMPTSTCGGKLKQPDMPELPSLFLNFSHGKGARRSKSVCLRQYQNSFNVEPHTSDKLCNNLREASRMNNQLANPQLCYWFGQSNWGESERKALNLGSRRQKLNYYPKTG